MDGDERRALESAEAHLRAARYDDALAQVADWPQWPEEIGARAALVVAEVKLNRDGPASLGFLAPLEELFSTPELRFRRELAMSRAYGRVRNFDATELCLTRAENTIREYPQGAGALAYAKALLRFWRQELGLDDADLINALADASPSLRLRAHSLRAWIHGFGHDYKAQIDDLSKSVSVYLEQGPADITMSSAAMSTLSLARVAFETAHHDGIAIVERALDAIPWTADIAEEHMNVLRCLGLDAFMRGESAQAQWYFRDGLALAPSAAFRVQCHLDRALVARIGGNEPWALDELFEAERESATVAWGDTFGEERMVLSVFAQMYATVDTSRAHYYAAAYSRLGLGNINPNLAMSRDPRAAALDAHARGCIEQTLGDRETAVRTFTSVYDVFHGIDHHYRAASAALALYELTRLPEWKARAKQHIAPYGTASPLAASLDLSPVAQQSDVPESLTPFQRQLLQALIRGEDLERISRRFSRSAYTISKQVDHIYSRLGVSSLHGLRREAERRGIA